MHKGREKRTGGTKGGKRRHGVCAFRKASGRVTTEKEKMIERTIHSREGRPNVQSTGKEVAMPC